MPTEKTKARNYFILILLGTIGFTLVALFDIYHFIFDRDGGWNDLVIIMWLFLAYMGWVNTIEKFKIFKALQSQ